MIWSTTLNPNPKVSAPPSIQASQNVGPLRKLEMYEPQSKVLVMKQIPKGSKYSNNKAFGYLRP